MGTCWESPYCESLTIKGHWYWCLKVFQTQNRQTPGGPLFQIRFHPDSIQRDSTKTVELASDPTHLMCMCFMIACVLVFSSAFGGSDSRSCTWRQTLVSEWKAQISRNQCGHVHNVISPNSSFSHITDALRSEINYSSAQIPVEVLQKGTMTGSHPFRFFLNLTRISGSQERSHVIQEAGRFYLFPLYFLFISSFLHLQLYASDNRVHRAPVSFTLRTKQALHLSEKEKWDLYFFYIVGTSLTK